MARSNTVYLKLKAFFESNVGSYFTADQIPWGFTEASTETVGREIRHLAKSGVIVSKKSEPKAGRSQYKLWTLKVIGQQSLQLGGDNDNK